MTKLTAVNRILSDCGTRPVSALQTGQGSPAGRAEAILNEIELEVQSEGWHYNTRRDVELTPGSDDKIAVPSDVITIDSDKRDNWRDVVREGSHLYDITNNTDEFDNPIRVRYTLRFPFDCIPQPVAEWIASKAAAEYNVRWKGDGNQRLLELKAERREAKARQFNTRQSNDNVLDSDEIRRTKGTRTRRFRESW